MLTEEQLEKRLNYITGSDASVIAGINPYKTKLQLWMEKTRRAEADDIGHLNHIKFGNFFECGVALWFSSESGLRVSFDSPFSEERRLLRDTADWFKSASGLKLSPNPSEMLVHPTIPYLAGNVDFYIDGQNAILECKTAFKDDGWGDGENIIPAHYLLQVAHYCAVGGFDRAYVAVVFAAKREMRYYTYERSQKLEDKLIAKEKDFWENYVLADVCPEPENEQDILSLYKEANFDPIVALPEVACLVVEYARINSAIKKLEAHKEAHRNAITLHMKNHELLLDAAGNQLATWKYTKTSRRFDVKMFEKENNEMHAKYIKEGEKQRRFVIKGVGDER